jgi:WD40 repeat protein
MFKRTRRYIVAMAVGLSGFAGFEPHGEGSVQPAVQIRKPDGTILIPDGEFPRGLRFTPNGESLVAVAVKRNSVDSEFWIWDFKSRKIVHRLPLENAPGSFCLTPDGKKLICASKDQQLQVWDLEKLRLVDSLPVGKKKGIYNLQSFPDGVRVLAISRDDQYGPMVWSLTQRRATHASGERNDLAYAAISPNGRQFAIGYYSVYVRDKSTALVVWDADPLKVAHKIEVKGLISSVTFSPDGKTLAAGSVSAEGDSTAWRFLVSIWDAETYMKLQDCAGAMDSPESIAYSPDSKLVVSGTGLEPQGPGKVCIWEAATGKLLMAFHPSQRGCTEVVVSPDGKWLVTRDADFAMLQIWDFEKIRREIGK